VAVKGRLKRQAVFTETGQLKLDGLPRELTSPRRRSGGQGQERVQIDLKETESSRHHGKT